MKNKIIALIPARGGSKGIPNKNITNINGKPLIYWTINIALSCKYFDKVVVTTDSERIRDVALSCGADVPFLRPSNISQDNSTDLEFLKHYVNWAENKEDYDADLIVQLRPTIPFRNVDDLNKSIELFLKNYENYDSLRSVFEINDKHPIKTYKIKDNLLTPFVREIDGLKEPYNMGRQFIPKAYSHTGNIDIIKKTTILELNSVSGNRILPYIEKSKLVDIDTYDDLHKAFNKINLLVTGGCGFIGSNFINYIFDKNKYNIINFDAMYYCANENNINENIRNSKFYTLVKGNLCSKDLINHVLYTHKIDEVIHLAAQSHVQNSFEDSLQFTQDNILGTHTLLECCRKYRKINKFIHVSTDEVYGESMNNVNEMHKTEQSILCPTNPYAATKAGAELIVQSYNHSYGMPIIISRGNNVFGPNQYPEKLIPRFIELLKEDKKVTIQGDGSTVRAFLHAYDTARAFECILENGKIGEIYNIGCDENMEYSVMEIAKILIKLIKNTENYDEWIEYIEDRPFNDQRYYISNQKLKDLGWDIELDLMTGLKDLVFNDFKINILELKLLDNKKNTKYFGDWIK